MSDNQVPTEANAQTEPPKKKRGFWPFSDTVRSRKKDMAASVQKYLHISQIKNDTVILKNGGLRAVIEVQAINFNLKSETEQKAIIAGYESFVNTLTFPVQIIVRSTKMNIDPYLETLKSVAEKHQNPLLKEQTEHYSKFVKRIVDIADIMQKRFFIVVPLDASVKQSNTLGQFFSWMNNDDSLSKIQATLKGFSEKSNQLRERILLVESGLSNVGLTTHRLNTHQLIELYYHVYNPSTAQQQKLNQELNTEAGIL